jgi:hypothetical protein
MRSLDVLATGETGSFRRKPSEADGLSRVSELPTLLTLFLGVVTMNSSAAAAACAALSSPACSSDAARGRGGGGGTLRSKKDVSACLWSSSSRRRPRRLSTSSSAIAALICVRHESTRRAHAHVQPSATQSQDNALGECPVQRLGRVPGTTPRPCAACVGSLEGMGGARHAPSSSRASRAQRRMRRRPGRFPMSSRRSTLRRMSNEQRPRETQAGPSGLLRG